MYADAAATIMHLRQGGVALGDVLKGLDDFPEENRPTAREMVLQAFEVPRFNSDQVKSEQIGDFRDKIHLACLRGSL